MEHSAIGTALVSLDGRWLEINAALRKIVGYAEEELRLLTFQDITHPDDLDDDLQLLQRLLAGAIPSYQMEKRYIRKDKSTVWILLTVALVRDEDGQPLYFISQVQDISGRKADEAERARLFERMTLATRAAQIGIWEREFASDMMTWDAQVFRLFGLPQTSQPIRFATFRNAVHPEDWPRVAKAIAAAKRGSPYAIEFRVCRPNGEIRTIKALAIVLHGHDGQPERIIGANYDVTEIRTLADQAQEASLAKSQFLAVMSHEIRTPLNGILGMAQAMAAEPLPDSQRKRVEIIRESGDALLAILNEVLDLSKVESGKLELEQVEFDLGRLLAGVHASGGALAHDSGLTFVLDLGDAAGIYLGDPTRVRQIVANLVSNALKFTSRGGVRISANRHDSTVEITVTDSGIGIPDDVLPRIFSPFAQADASTTRRHGGTGLGLSIVKELTNLMGGHVTVESVPGVGSTFRVALQIPYVAAPSSSQHDFQPHIEDGASDSVGLRVLAAEDNEVNRLVLGTLLNQMGIEPSFVSNGCEAIEAWRHHAWDVILMDVQMPVMDGLAASRAIRDEEMHAGRGHTPIIALTANAMPEQVAECHACGMDLLVAKPIDVRSLAAALARSMNLEHRPERAQVQAGLKA